MLTLGITTIGDLLVNNRITRAGTDGKPLENILLNIPEYQRPYKWTAKNAIQLFDDIEMAKEDNKEVYRVGTLILHHELKDGNDIYNIVDGQQRIITFSLLLTGLGSGNIAFVNQEVSYNPYNIQNIQNNLYAFDRRIEKLGDKQNQQQLLDYISSQCELVVVITDNLSEAFQFFDSQNARGKALYPHDLLKAYHLREMSGISASETEDIVNKWENLDQKKLASLFNDYLYRLKVWIKGNRAGVLNDQNIDMFKGLTARESYPYAQFYKGAFAYAVQINHSQVPFVTGIQHLNPFQIDAPVIAGKPFFAYAEHYFNILVDIQDNDKYKGYLVNDNEIIRTLDLRQYRNGVGNNITRLMLDTALLLYADRFCAEIPSRQELDYLNRFTVYAFIWAYSMRAQYLNVGWLTAQNYILGDPWRSGITNAFNIYKLIAEADSPNMLLNILADQLRPLNDNSIRSAKEKEAADKVEDGIYQGYLHYFDQYKFWRRNHV